MRSYVGFASLALWMVTAGLPCAEAAPRPDYRFAPGDVIDVTVLPQSKFDRTVTVQPDGKISYPIAGSLQAAGLTVPELAERLRKALHKDLVNPKVTISLKELNKQAVARVSILGAVRNPGTHEIKEGTTVTEVLAQSGGPTQIADLRRIVITREDQSVITVDLSRTPKTGRIEKNAVLQSGDMIVVPEGAPPTVLVLGEVAKPGSYELRGEARLLDALTAAGGPTPKADLHHVTLGRAGVAGTRTLDVQPLIEKGDVSNPAINFVLQPGDTIVLGETAQRVYVMGRVSNPNIYPLKPNDRVLDAIARAGGAAPDGETAKAVLVRRDASGQPVAKPIDVKKMMEKGSLGQNELLQPGDILFVPDKKPRRAPTEPWQYLFPLAGLLLR